MARSGPKTPRGKAAVRFNAVRHGLRSTAVVIPGLERQSDWEQFLEDSIAALNPDGAIEYALAERAASLLWRLRRSGRAERDAAIAFAVVEKPGQSMETAITGLRNYFHQVFDVQGESEPEPESPRPPPPPPALLPAPEKLLVLSHYEWRLSRQLVHTMHVLHSLQERRGGSTTPPPPAQGAA